jgi:transposase
MHVYPARALERAMKAKEVITRVLSGEMNWMQAAEILGMTDRQLRRWRKKWEKYGYEDLFDRRMKRPSPKRVALGDLEQVLRLYRETYFDLNVKHFVEKLHEQHQIRFSYTWVKAALQTAGLVQRYRKRGPHRKKRPRRPLPGMLLHVDGSRHRWIPGLDAYQDLIVVFDDATSEMYYARLVEEESTETVMAGLKQVIADRGVFCALYSDRGSHFVYTPQAGKAPDRRVKTQIGRALEQMRIELIAANSPEARGRCERLFGTWQGRLPQEIRLRNISTVEAANAYLPEWIDSEHNRKFSIAAQEPGTAFLPYGGTELDKIWSNQQERIVGNDNTVTYGKLSLQVPQQSAGLLQPSRPAFVDCESQIGTGCGSSGLPIVAYKRSWGEVFPDDAPGSGERKKKGPKKKEWGGLMETDAAVEKQRTFFPPLLAKPFGFRTVPTAPAAINQQTIKPDISLATKTGHFHLLPTSFCTGFCGVSF